MKRKLIRRNKSLLFELCKTAKKHDLLLSDLLCLIKRKSDICGFIKADEKGLLTEDWSQAEFDKGLVSVPKVDPNGKIFCYRMFFNKKRLPIKYQSQWLD